MPMLALIAPVDGPGGEEAARPLRAFLEPFEAPRLLVAPTDAARTTAELVGASGTVEAALAPARPGEAASDVARRATAALCAAAPALAVADAGVIGAIVAAALSARPDDWAPGPGTVSLVRDTGDELTLMMHGLSPADPLRRTAPDRVERRLYLVRHAETETVTPDGRVFSHAPLPLTDRGREQAAALAEAFADVPAATVHASDIARVAETAGAIAGDRREVRLYAGLREIPLGELEGAHFNEIFAPATGFLAHPDVALPGGESFRAVGERAIAALNGILATETGHDAIVLAHGGVNRALLGLLLGVPGERALRIRQDWAGVNVLDRVDGRWRPGTINWSPAGLEELEHARRAALVSHGPTGLGGHVMDWRSA